LSTKKVIKIKLFLSTIQGDLTLKIPYFLEAKMPSSNLVHLTYTDALAFWRRVNRLIKDKNLTQEAVSSIMGINYTTFRGWSHIKNYPNLPNIHLLAQALDTTMNFLIFGVDIEPCIQVEYIVGEKVIELLQLLIAVNQPKK
jgi:transcriptional regulator with XRE-family HTH domain